MDEACEYRSLVSRRVIGARAGWTTLIHGQSLIDTPHLVSILVGLCNVSFELPNKKRKNFFG
jgi:hypothetical protein